MAEPLSICLSIYLYIIHADYFCQAMADLKQKYYTLILKFTYITFTDGTTGYVAAEIVDGIDLILL